VLDDYTSAPVSEKLRATLGYLKKLTLTPAEVKPGDVTTLLDLGITREAVVEAMYVLYLFCTYDRLADALGWHVPSQEAFEASARVLLKRGYL